MQVKMQGNLVGVEAPRKASKSSSAFYMPEDANVVGVIRYVGKDVKNADLKVGAKVIYGDKRQEVQIEGVKILVMAEENVVAIVEDVNETTQPEAASA